MANELDPRTRKEVFLAGMLYGDPDDLPDPNTRDELYMKAIAETIKEGGVPSPEGADVGDVLTIGSDGPEWAAPSGGNVELWQHQAFFIPRNMGNTALAELNNIQMECTFYTNSSSFVPATIKQFPASVWNQSGKMVNIYLNGNGGSSVSLASSTVSLSLTPSGSNPYLEYVVGSKFQII